MSAQEFLLGEYESKIDDKGRVLLRDNMRHALAGGFAVSLGTVGCLAIFPKSVWDDLCRNVLGCDVTNLGREMYTRLMLGPSENNLKCDSQGRVVIPPSLRQATQIAEKSQVKVIGCGDRIEIWEKSEHESYMKSPATYGEERRKLITEALRLMAGNAA